MKHLQAILCVTFVCIATASNAIEKTWICDSKKIAGFDSENGYEVITFSDRRSYRVKSGIKRDYFTKEIDKERFDRMVDMGLFQPASIEELGRSIVSLCRHSEVKLQGFKLNMINCDNPMFTFGGDFSFSLDTGLYSVVNSGFEYGDGSQSWVEVGECRKIN